MNEEKLLTVARYLEGDMEFQEKESFEAALQHDTELQGLVVEYQNIHQTLKMRIAPTAADMEVEATLASLNEQYFKEQNVVPNTAKIVPLTQYMKWLSIAAVLVIGLFVWAPWSANLYEKYAISKEMSVAERGATTEGTLEKAATLYNEKDYAGAAKLLEKEYLAKPENSMVAYYYGVALVETDQFDAARNVLMKLYAKSSVFKYDANYYVGLSYVKQKNNIDAIFWLNQIPEGTANYNKARELINKLK